MGCGLSAFCKRPKRGESPNLDAPIRRNVPTPKIDHLPIADSPHDENPRPLQANIDLPAIDEESPADGPQQLPVFLTVTKKKPIGITNVVTTQIEESSYEIRDSFEDNSRQNSFYTPSYKDGCLESQQYLVLKEEIEREESQVNIDPEDVKFTPEDEQAATKIQASYRGFKTRKALETGAAIAGAEGIGFFPLQKDTQKLQASTASSNQNLSTTGSISPIVNSRDSSHEPENIRSTNGYYLLKEEASISNLNIAESSSYQVSEPEDYHKEDKENFSRLQTGDDTDPLIQDESDDEPNEYTNNCLIDFTNACEEYRQQFKVEIDPKQPVLSNKTVSENFEKENIQTIQTGNVSSNLIANHNIEPIEKSEVLMVNIENRKENAKIRNEKGVCQVNSSYSEHETHDEEKNYDNEVKNKTNTTAHYENHGFKDKDDDRQDSTKITVNAEEQVWHFKSNREIKSVLQEISDEHRNSSDMKENNGPSDKESYVVLARTVSAANNEEAYSEKIQGQVTTTAEEDFAYTGKEHNIKSGNDVEHTQDYSSSLSSGNFLPKSEARKVLSEFWNQPVRQETIKTEPKSIEADDVLQFVDDHRVSGYHQIATGYDSQFLNATSMHKSAEGMGETLEEAEDIVHDDNQPSIACSASAEELQTEINTSTDSTIPNTPQKRHKLNTERNKDSHSDNILDNMNIEMQSRESDKNTMSGYIENPPDYQTENENDNEVEIIIRNSTDFDDEIANVILTALGSGESHPCFTEASILPSPTYHEDFGDAPLIHNIPVTSSRSNVSCNDPSIQFFKIEGKNSALDQVAIVGETKLPIASDSDPECVNPIFHVSEIDLIQPNEKGTENVIKKTEEICIYAEEPSISDAEIIDYGQSIEPLEAETIDTNFSHLERKHEALQYKNTYTEVPNIRAKSCDRGINYSEIENSVIDEGISNANSLKIQPNHIVFDKKVENTEIYESQGCLWKTDRQESCYQETIKKLSQSYNSYENPKSTELLDTPLEGQIKSGQSSLADESITTTEGTENDRSFPDVEININFSRKTLESKGRQEGDDEVSTIISSDSIPPYNEQCSNSHSLLQKNTEIENSLVTDTPSIIIRADDMDEDEYIWRKLQGYSSLDEDDTYVKAVTKIQATYRGYLTRRDLENDSKKEDTTNNLDIEEDEELNLNLQESCSVLDNNEGQTNANIEKIDCLVKDSPGLRCNEEPDLIASETELLLKDKNKGTLKSRDKQRNSKGFEQSFEADNEPFDNTSLKDNIISDTDHAPAEDDSIRVFSTVKSETEYKGFVTDKTSSFYDEAQDFQTQDRNDEKKKNHYFTENQKFGEKQQETLKNEKLEESNETNLLTHIHDLQTEDSSIQVNLDSKPFSPESDDNLSKVEAAVKIQAAFRGHRTRRGVADQLSITTVETEKSAFVENAHDVIKNNAAVKIQAAFRGHKTRRELIDLLSSSAAEDGEIVKDVEIPLGKNAFDGLENEAAVKFKTDFDEQKVGKESLENNLLKNAIAQNEKNIKEVRLPLCKDEIEKEAAVKIQSSFRGHMARRQLEENDSIDKFDCGTIKIVETSDSNGLDESNILFESKSTLKINETEAEDSSAHECLRQREIKIGQRDEERNSNGCKKNIDLKKKEINEDILSEDTEIQHLQKYNKRDSISDFRSQESLIQSHDLNMPNEKVPGLSKYALEVCVAAEITGNETFSETDKKTNVNTIRDDVELVPKIISDGISSKNESFSPLNIISTEDVYQPECKETSQPETYYHKKSLEQNECPEEKVLDNSEIKKQSSDVQTKDELENITVPDSETEAATNKINNDDQILIVVENLCPSREFVFVTAEFNPKSSDCDTRNEDPCAGRDQGKSLQCIKNPENFTGRDKVSDKIDYVKVPILINGKTSSQVNEKDTEIPKEKQEALTEETDRNGRDGYENNKLCTVFDKMYVNINIPDDQRLMGQKPIFPTNERSMETNTQTYSLEREHNLDSKTNGKETNDNTKLQEKPILREGNSDIQVNDKDTEPMSKFQERKVEKRDTSCCNSNIEVQAICVDQEHDLKRKLSLHLDSEDNSKLCSKEDVHDKILSTETLKKEAVSEKNLDESAISYKEILREIRNDDEAKELPTQTTLENPITTGVNDMRKDIVDIQNPIINVELNPKYSFLSQNEPKVQHSNRDSGIRISPKETNEFKAEFPQRIQGKIDLPCSLSKEEKEMTDNTKIESEPSNKSNEETETLSEESNNKEKIADSISETHREAMEECGINKEFNSENNFTEESKQPLENFSARKGFEDYESGTKIPSIETNYALSPNHKLNEESVDSIDFKELQPNVVPKRDVLGRDHSDGEFGNGTLFSEYVKIGVEPRERENNELKKAMTEAKVYISNKGDSIQQEAPTNENDPEHRVRIDNSEESEPQIKIFESLDDSPIARTKDADRQEDSSVTKHGSDTSRECSEKQNNNDMHGETFEFSIISKTISNLRSVPSLNSENSPFDSASVAVSLPLQNISTKNISNSSNDHSPIVKSMNTDGSEPSTAELIKENLYTGVSQSDEEVFKRASKDRVFENQKGGSVPTVDRIHIGDLDVSRATKEKTIDEIHIETESSINKNKMTSVTPKSDNRIKSTALKSLTTNILPGVSSQEKYKEDFYIDVLDTNSIAPDSLETIDEKLDENSFLDSLEVNPTKRMSDNFEVPLVYLINSLEFEHDSLSIVDKVPTDSLEVCNDDKIYLKEKLLDDETFPAISLVSDVTDGSHIELLDVQGHIDETAIAPDCNAPSREQVPQYFSLQARSLSTTDVEESDVFLLAARSNSLEDFAQLEKKIEEEFISNNLETKNFFEVKEKSQDNQVLKNQLMPDVIPPMIETCYQSNILNPISGNVKAKKGNNNTIKSERAADNDSIINSRQSDQTKIEFCQIAPDFSEEIVTALCSSLNKESTEVKVEDLDHLAKINDQISHNELEVKAVGIKSVDDLVHNLESSMHMSTNICQNVSFKEQFQETDAVARTKDSIVANSLESKFLTFDSLNEDIEQGSAEDLNNLSKLNDEFPHTECEVESVGNKIFDNPVGNHCHKDNVREIVQEIDTAAKAEDIAVNSLASDYSESDLRASEISDFIRDINGERFPRDSTIDGKVCNSSKEEEINVDPKILGKEEIALIENWKDRGSTSPSEICDDRNFLDEDLATKEASEMIDSIVKAIEEVEFIALSHESPVYEKPTLDDIFKFNVDTEEFEIDEIDSQEETDHSSDWSDVEKKDDQDILNVAATKIQAQYRGYKVRQRLKRQKYLQSKNPQNRERRESQQNTLPDNQRVPNLHGFEDCTELQKAATKIQAGVRGFLVRRAMRSLRRERRRSSGASRGIYSYIRKSNRRHSDVLPRRSSDPPLSLNPSEFSRQLGSMHEVVAATIIQAYFRGYKTRKNMNRSPRKTKSAEEEGSEANTREHCAATKIQAAFRGYNTRKDIRHKKLYSKDGTSNKATNVEKETNQ